MLLTENPAMLIPTANAFPAALAAAGIKITFHKKQMKNACAMPSA